MKEASYTPRGGRPSLEAGEAENHRPGEGKEPRVQEYDSRPRQEFRPQTGSGKGDPAHTLTFRLPHRQRCLSALTPEELQGREPGSRGAHYSACHEASQKLPGALQAGYKTFGSHLTRRTGLFSVAHAHTASDA